MKLRNKKTGEIKSTWSKDLCINFGDCNQIFSSLTELNEWWEDYKPVEPLIKDKKIRKAVRVWADASGITKVLSYGDYFWLGLRSTDKESVWKFECNYRDASDLQNKDYTIAELCGEEEE